MVDGTLMVLRWCIQAGWQYDLQGLFSDFDGEIADGNWIVTVIAK